MIYIFKDTIKKVQAAICKSNENNYILMVFFEQ